MRWYLAVADILYLTLKINIAKTSLSLWPLYRPCNYYLCFLYGTMIKVFSAFCALLTLHFARTLTTNLSITCAVVSDSPYPNEAFSIGEERDGENAVEVPLVEDIDECVMEDKLCHHRCVNTPGSYRCECFPGYVLQEDAFTCLPGKAELTNLTLSHRVGSIFPEMPVDRKTTLCAIGSLKCDLQSAFLSVRPHLS